MTTTYRIEGLTCPACAAKIDGATVAHGPDEKPKPGDITLCIYCGQLLEFAAEGVRKLSREAFEDLSAESRYALLTSQLQCARRRGRKLGREELS